MKHAFHAKDGGSVAAVCRAALCACLCILFLQPVKAQEADSIAIEKPYVVSLLTCGPGDEVYELYGHTALRVRGGSDAIDRVYNYGYFNFKRPHFLWHFVLGETDYSLRTMPMARFYWLYTEEGRWIDEQVFNLTPAEAERVYRALEANNLEAVADGWTYRYNYLTDNCTTRAIAMVEEAVGARFQPADTARATYRSALHRYTPGHAWAQFGNDMLLGARADDSIDARAQLFLPVEAERLLETATLAGDSVRPALSATRRMADFPPKPAETSLPPMVYALLLLLLTAAATLYEWRRRKVLWGYDGALLSLQGVAGCLVCFMLCFSEHPTVGSNLLCVWLNPLPLLVAWPVCRRLRRHLPARYFWVQTALLVTFFVLFAVRAQAFPAASAVLALCLLIRAVWNTLRHYYKPLQP
ncbi:MAG: DUF4105 domain-containing protein [Bacteroidaceae bacterium]|nr:DUF4105 domain-containing protein [Bacteroidaceae bacterium]